MKALIMTLAFMGSTALAESPVLPILPDGVHYRVENAVLTGDCTLDTFFEDEVHELEGGANLYIIGCMNGAYQTTEIAFLMDRFENVTPVITLAYDSEVGGVVGTNFLTSASYDPETQILYTHAKSRGPGDCGQSSRSQITVYDGYPSIKTFQINAKETCDGQFTEWPIVFQQ